MSIKGKIGSSVISLGAAVDTVLLDITADRVSISSGILHNNGAGTIIVDIYVSPDLTSASGSRIGQYTIAVDELKQIDCLIGQGFSSAENIIANADVAGCNALFARTDYTGGS